MKAFIIIVSCILGMVLFFVIVSAVAFVKMFRRRDDEIFDQKDMRGTHYEPHIGPLYAAIGRMREEPYTERSIVSRDGKTLRANYYDRGSNRTAIVVHGYRSNPYNNFSVIGGAMLDRGYNVLAIYQRAHGKSDGKYMTMGLKEQYDVLDWIDLVAADPGVTDIIVYGTSMGGATVAYMSDKVTCQKVKALTVDCGFTSYADEYKVLTGVVAKKIFKLALPMFCLYGRMFFGVNFRKSNTQSVAACKLPMCFIHGEADDYVPLSHTLKNYEACNSEKQLITVPGAGHTTAMLVGGEESIQKYFDFIERYISPCKNKGD